MNTIATFNSTDMQILHSNGEPCMTAESIGLALEYSEPRKAIMNLFNRKREELEEHSGVLNLMTPGGKQAVTIFNESGVMLLTMLSAQPRAKDFRRWAVRVLKQYRQEAQSFDPRKMFDDPSAMRELLLGYTEKVLQLEDTVAEQAPKAKAFDRLTSTEGTLCITDAAKNIGIRPKDLTQLMFANGWIYKRYGSPWVAYASKLHQQLLMHKSVLISGSDEEPRYAQQVRITQKGLSRLALMVEQLDEAV